MLKIEDIVGAVIPYSNHRRVKRAHTIISRQRGRLIEIVTAGVY